MNNKVALLVCLGQSNSHGHGTKMSQEDSCEIIFTDVFGLSRKHNQSFTCEEVVWEPFRYHGMNLGEIQDNTVCLAHEFAKLWQLEKTNNAALPSLYIIQMSIGAQGISKFDPTNKNMWYPQRRLTLIPGPLVLVDISLYPLLEHILPLALQSLRKKGAVEVVGVHWNQWETEVDTGGKAIEEALLNYTEFFEGLDKMINQTYPLYLTRPLSEVYQNPKALQTMIDVFETLCEKRDNTFLIDLKEAEFFDASRADKGIFQEDLVHYLPRAHTWFAQKQWKDWIKKQ